MIISYGGRNCWAFKEWMEINFRINKNVPEEYGYLGTRIVPALCFEGGNASGKSCALRVLSFIADFCLNSFSYDLKSGIYYNTFFHNNEKSDFFIVFSLNRDMSVEYSYKVTMDMKKVYSEEFSFRKNGGKKTVLMKRRGNKFISNSFDGERIILKDNSSMLSTCFQYGVNELDDIRDFFHQINSNVGFVGMYIDPLDDNVAKYYHNHPEIHRKVVDVLKRYDTGISDVEIEKAVGRDGKYLYYSVFKHEIANDEKELTFLEQSTGTKTLYNRLMDYITTLDQGGVLIFDELDTHIHYSIVHILINDFLDPMINTNGAQIVFTSHDPAILDMMKKYRTYLFKKEEGESFCYRIDELPKNIGYRNDRSLTQLYMSGMIGGLPNVQSK